MTAPDHYKLDVNDLKAFLVMPGQGIGGSFV